MPRLSVSNDTSRSDAPANSIAMRHQVSGVWMSCARSLGCPSSQQPGVQFRCTSIWRLGVAIRASERIVSTALRRAASCPWSSAGKRSSILWLSRSPAAISTPSARSQGALSSTAPAPCARVSNWVASITRTDGPWPRRNSRQARWIGSPAGPHSARPDSCKTRSRSRGASDCARCKPGIARSSVAAGATDPAIVAPSSHVGRCGRSLTTAARHYFVQGRPSADGRTVRGADPAPRWLHRTTGSRSRTSSRTRAATRHRCGPCNSRT